MAAHDRRVRSRELPRRFRQSHLTPGQTGALGCKRNVEVRFLCNGPQASRYCALERLSRALLDETFDFGIRSHTSPGVPGRMLHMLSRKALLQLSATFTDDSGSSVPKQR